MILAVLLWSSPALAEDIPYRDYLLRQQGLEVCIETAKDGVILERRMMENNSVTLVVSMTDKRHCTLIKVFDGQSQTNRFDCMCSTISNN